MRYIGEGRFRPGIPARDLTEAEVKQFGRKFLLETGLYKISSRKATRKPTDHKALTGPEENKAN